MLFILFFFAETKWVTKDAPAVEGLSLMRPGVWGNPVKYYVVHGRKKKAPPVYLDCCASDSRPSARSFLLMYVCMHVCMSTHMNRVHRFAFFKRHTWINHRPQF